VGHGPEWPGGPNASWAGAERKKNKEESGLGRGWAGKRREEAGPNPLLGLKSRRIKENQF
jgi:hypothetical protein